MSCCMEHTNMRDAGIREKDAELQWRKEDHHLHKLHRELYENNEKHAGDVYYALVCSVQFDAEESKNRPHR